MSSTQKYTLPARILHWLLAIGIVTAFTIAISLDDIPRGPEKLRYINYHKWVGITVLGLAALRLLWRLGHRPPAMLAQMQAWEKKVATVTHGLLYLLMFAVPLGGWLFSSAKGYPVVYLGLVQLPDLIGKTSKDVAEQIQQVHELGGWTVIILAGLHMLAGLKHHFLNKDDVLKRML
jgi:cytochrome b561